MEFMHFLYYLPGYYAVLGVTIHLQSTKAH